MRVLQQEQALRPLAGLQGRARRELQLDGLRVGDAAEVVPVERAARGIVCIDGGIVVGLL